MKKLILATLLAVSTFAQAQYTSCGFPPFPPFGMVYVCVCDARGQNCQWILVSKR